MKLYEIAQSRAGDKGDVSTLSLIPYQEKDFEKLVNTVTAERVKAHMTNVRGRVDRFVLPNISSLLFVCHEALGGGVTTSLAIDTHGKCLSSVLLEMEI